MYSTCTKAIGENGGFLPLMKRVDGDSHFAFVLSVKLWGNLDMHHSSIPPFHDREPVTVAGIH